MLENTCAPDLRIEAAATGVEHTHHRPVTAGETQGLAQARTGEARGHGAAGDDLAGAGPKHASLHEVNLGPQRQPGERCATHRDIAGLAAGALGQRVEHHRLTRHQPVPVPVGGHAGQALDHSGLVA
jgi:hypothetical protein